MQLVERGALLYEEQGCDCCEAQWEMHGDSG